MQEEKHTPAPWMVSETEKKALAIFPANYKGRPRALCSIAFVQSWNDTADDMANARLIASAPNMLDALREAERFLDYFANGRTSFVGSGTPQSALEIVQKAIAKATVA